MSAIRSFRCQWCAWWVGFWAVDGPDRAAAVRRLVALEGSSRLGVEQVELAAAGLGVSSRTVWRWIRQARAGEGLSRRPDGHLELTDEIRHRLAFWRGNAAAVHRELVEAAKTGGPAAPSLSTLQRAVARDLRPGDRGPGTGRAWQVVSGPARVRRLSAAASHASERGLEADHVEAAVEVDVEGRLLKPW